MEELLLLEEVKLGRSWEESSPATWPEVAGRRLGRPGVAHAREEEEEEERNERRKERKGKNRNVKGSLYRFEIL